MPAEEYDQAVTTEEQPDQKVGSSRKAASKSLAARLSMGFRHCRRAAVFRVFDHYGDFLKSRPRPLSGTCRANFTKSPGGKWFANGQ